MKRNCKTCTLNTTNDTVETCKRMCYLRYSKQRNKRICDLEQEIKNLKQTLAEIKEIAEKIDDSDGCAYGDYCCDNCSSLEQETVCTYKVKKLILQKISEVEE